MTALATVLLAWTVGAASVLARQDSQQQAVGPSPQTYVAPTLQQMEAMRQQMSAPLSPTEMQKQIQRQSAVLHGVQWASSNSGADVISVHETTSWQGFSAPSDREIPLPSAPLRTIQDAVTNGPQDWNRSGAKLPPLQISSPAVARPQGSLTLLRVEPVDNGLHVRSDQGPRLFMDSGARALIAVK